MDSAERHAVHLQPTDVKRGKEPQARRPRRRCRDCDPGTIYQPSHVELTRVNGEPVPKIACYKKVFANVKELQQALKAGGATELPRRPVVEQNWCLGSWLSCGARLQDLEVSGTANRSRAAKAESDSKGRALFGTSAERCEPGKGDAEEDLKDFTPSDKARGAGTLGAQLRSEAEESGEARNGAGGIPETGSSPWGCLSGRVKDR
eukprot:Skav231251  [mRNA]  locus=scaffold411:514236:525659:- [translate_table: standard]